MTNVLITCAGGPGPSDLRTSLPKDCTVFLADANETVALRYPGIPFQKIPLGREPIFTEALRTLVKKWRIDWVAAGSDDELLPLDQLRTEGLVRCVMPRGEFIKMCRNKKVLMEALRRQGISTLLSFPSIDEVRYPAFAKPVTGRGSRGAHRINARGELEGYLQLYNVPYEDVLVQPFIGGMEYTVSVIVNNKNRIIGIVPKRVLEKRGLTLAAVSEKHDVIADVCERIVEKMNPCGPFNVQLKMDKGVCYIFEINPRLSSTAVLTDRAFGNEIALAIQYEDADIIKAPPKMQEGVSMSRFYTQAIFTE